MKALLWKDFYVNRVILGATAGGLILPYVIGIVRNLIVAARDSSEWSEPWGTLIFALAAYGLLLSALGLAVLCGNAFAGERAERTAEFLRSQPVTPLQILLSKAIVAAAAALGVWLIQIVVIFGVVPCLRYFSYRGSEFDWSAGAEVLTHAVSVTVLAGGVAWFCSSVSASPAIASVVGIAAPIILIVAIASASYVSGSQSPDDPAFAIWHRNLALLFGGVGFAVGSIHYLRRVEP